MGSFKDLPIRRKLTLFIMLVSCLAVLLAVMAVVGYEIFTFRQRAVRDLATLTEMVAVSTQSALDFDDAKLAHEVLNTLRGNRGILSAGIYGQNETVFATYARADLKRIAPPTPRPDSHEFANGSLFMFRQIVSNGEILGTVYLQQDLALAFSRLPYYGFILGLVAVGLLVLSWILSAVLQRLISTPILRLAHVAQRINENKDYTVRAAKESNDEIGQLTAIFNQMLVTIAAREAALNQANTELEKRGFELERELAERKRVEEALEESRAKLKQYAGELELRVNTRTASLQESLRSLEGVLYHVAHDLRAPLRAMQGFTTLLLDQYAPNLDATGKAYAEKVSAAAIRMDRLICDLLEYGRLGHVALPPQPVDLRAHISAVLTQLAEEARIKNALVRVDEPLPGVWANPSVLGQVLTNLLSNALKFVPSGTVPQIHIWSEAGPGKVRLWIQDNGIGIEPEHQERIFRVFERLHRMEVFPGTGIGLAIVRKGMERMGGQVGVESTCGAGSRFWLDFPIARKHDHD